MSSAASSAQPPAASAARPVRFGFLGAGAIARRALGPAVAAAEHAELYAVAARDPERARALGPSGPVYATYPELLADPDVDVVYVGLHNAGHLPWVLAALDAGKHVLCEKPLGLDEASVATMTQRAAATGRLLVEAFWYRWHPRTRRLEELLAAGALGPVREVEADFSFAGPAESDPATAYRLDPAPGAGGGALYDVGCYALSAVHLALGGAPDVVSATVRRGPTGVDLETSAELRTPDGAVARIRCGIAVADRQVLRVAGEAAVAEFGPPAFTSLFTPSELVITTPDRAVRREAFAPVDPYRLMVDAVAAAVRGERAFLVDLDHSAHIAASIGAVQRALEGVSG